LYDRARGAFIADPLVDVRRHANNSSQRGEEFLVPDLVALNRAMTTVTSSHRAALSERIGRSWMRVGYHHLKAGHTTQAANAYAHALAYPGVRRAALIRLAASPLAPILSRARRRDVGRPTPHSST
jgi:hypothetical protein